MKKCPHCDSETGPYMDSLGSVSHDRHHSTQVKQVICTFCGMRGPYFVEKKSAEIAWDNLPRREDTNG